MASIDFGCGLFDSGDVEVVEPVGDEVNCGLIVFSADEHLIVNGFEADRCS